jgi:hypothetical protein
MCGLSSGGSEGVEFRANFMRPFAPRFAYPPKGPRVYLAEPITVADYSARHVGIAPVGAQYAEQSCERHIFLSR